MQREAKRNQEYRVSLADGENLIKQGQDQAAIVSLKKAVRLRPQLPHAHDSLGDAYAGAKMFDDAVQEYRRAIALSSGYPSTYLHLGNVLAEKGQLQDAGQAWKKVIEKDGAGPWAKMAQEQLNKYFLKP